MTVRGLILLRERLRLVRSGGDQGSVLAIALAFLMVFGVYVGVVLQFSATGLRTTGAVREAATNAYAGGGALDGAINSVRSSPMSGVGAAGTCFTLPVNELGNPTPVNVTCDPRAVSGANVTGPTPSQPGNAVTALSTVAAEGVSVTSGKTTLRGGVKINKRLTVPTGTTLDSTGYPVEAGQCSLSGTGTVKDICTVGGAVTDPNYPGPNLSTPALPAVQQTALPACTATTTLSPGIYRSQAALQTLLSCATATTIILKTGTYYFDFNLNTTHLLTFNGGARKIIGGSQLGVSGCDPTLPGVDLVFGGDSQLTVTSGTVDLCALEPVSTSQQHIVMRGLKSSPPVATTGSVVGASASSVGGTAWTGTPNNGAFPNGSTTTATLSGSGPPAAILRVLLPATVVPAEATNIFATITVKESLNANTNGLVTAKTTAILRNPAGTALSAALPLRTCSSAACAGGVLVDDSTTLIGPFTLADLNGAGLADVEVTLSKPGNGNVTGLIDGVTVNLSYQLNIRPVCILASTTTGCAGTAPFTQPASAMFSATGAYGTSPLGLHGTIYAPTARVTLGLTGVDGATKTVVDRGIVVWHLNLSMTGTSPQMITVPSLGLAPRRVVMIATDGSGAQLARADVTFANSAGTGNGDIPEVLEWSVG